HEDVVVHGALDKILDRLECQVDAPEPVSVVDLADAVAGDFDPHVAGNGEHLDLLRHQVEVRHDHRVGPGASGVRHVPVGPVAVQTHTEYIDTRLPGKELLWVEGDLDEIARLLDGGKGPVAAPEVSNVIEGAQPGQGGCQQHQSEHLESASEE